MFTAAAPEPARYRCLSCGEPLPENGYCDGCVAEKLRHISLEDTVDIVARVLKAVERGRAISAANTGKKYMTKKRKAAANG